MDINIFNDTKINNLTVRVIADNGVMEALILKILSPFAVPVKKNALLTVVITEGEVPEIKGECIYIGKAPEKLPPSQVFFSRPLDIEEFARTALGILKKSVMMTKSGWGADMSARSATYKDESVALSAKEMELYLLLLQSIGQCVDRERIESVLWADGRKGNSADVYACFLRKKLESITCSGVLVCVRGRGYMLREP